MKFGAEQGYDTLRRLRDDVDRLFDGFFGGRASGWNPMARAFPAVNVWETDDHLHVEAELPGVRREDLEISVLGDELTLQGVRPEAVEEGETRHRQERGVGRFSRTLRLPVEVKAEGVEASLEAGVLRLRLPKSEAAKPRKIAVRASS